ncbi:carboxypeptidase-like regulatory domain-containing protein, partial [candidate division KSB1 bacterium]|nr:carboxypeptidase-like regulatory domain-containing protein [candidate division KSB1 bacterium]
MKKATIIIGSLVLFVFSVAYSGTTGKIVGTVKDAENGEPLVGANVVLEGTSLGAAVDIQGNYFIINIPPGIYNLKIMMMGYNTVTVERTLVNVDLTTTVNAKLSPAVLEASEAVTVVAERPLVRLDMTSSLSAVGSEEIGNLPVESVTDVLELQAGIVRSGGDLHIRGGRAGEIAYWIDGVATTDVFSGRSGVTVENSAIEELQVVSGTFNAEYGQAMSGIINIITKEGGRKYSGQVKTYFGDYMSTDEHFQLAKSIENKVDPNTGEITPISKFDNPVKNINPIYNVELSLNGPVPFLVKKLSFYTNARYYSNEGHLYGRNWFTPQGNPGDSSLVPMNPYERLTAQGKLTYRMNPSLKLSYNLFYNDWKNDRTFSKDWKYCPYSRPQQFGGGITHIFTLNHVLSPSTFYEVRLNKFYNEYERYLYKDPYAMPKYLVKVYTDTTLNVAEHVFDPSTETGMAELDNIKQNRIRFKYIIDPNGPDGYISPDSTSAPTAYSFNTIGTDMEHYSRSTSYWIGKFDLTSQINRANQIKFGLEYRQHQLKLYRYEIRPQTNESGTEQIVPFTPTIPDISTTYMSKYTREPMEFSTYIQDKIELNDVIMNIGLRYDYFDANHVVPADPSDPNIYFPFKNRNRYRNWEDPPADLTLEEYDAYIASFEEYTPDERRAFMHKDSEPKMQFSPRLGIAYPITDKGVIHFSYGHFFQIPEFQYLYDNPDFKVSASSGY